MRILVSRLALTLFLCLWVPGVTQAQILVSDDFSAAAGTSPDASKFAWAGDVAQNGAGQLSLATWAVGTSWMRSLTNAVVGAGQTLVLKMRLSAYAEPLVYGDLQPRGLRVGSDANNALEFYSIWGDTIGLRARKDGAETLISYPFPAGVYSMHDYEISVTTTSAVFKVDGLVAGIITNNIPTGALNFHTTTSWQTFGNIPVTLDSMQLSLTNDAVVVPLDFTWTTNNGAITITHYIGTNGSVVIPSAITGLPVTTVGQSAFNEYYRAHVLTNVVIPDSVTNLADSAFAYCSSLTNVTIGKGLASLGNNAFYGCSGLQAFVVDSLNPVYSSLAGVLFNQAQTTLIQYPAGLSGGYVIPGTVTNIGGKAFESCGGLTGVTIPNSVVNIDYQAFYSCGNLANVTIPDSVTNALTQTFVWCSRLTNAVVGNGVTSLDGTFSQCNGLANVSLGGSITNISGAFVNCSALRNILIPASVVSLGDMAFAGCRGLTNLVIPDSVKRLGDSVFSACASLTSLTIPNGVPTIGNYAFDSCRSLNNVLLGSGITNLGNYAFKDCSGLTNLVIPAGVTQLGISVFQACTNLDSMTIPNGVTSISYGLFSSCTRLVNVTLPNSVTRIENWAFYNCSSLTSLLIPNSVTNIGFDVFYKCTGLASITIPDSVTSFGSDAFRDCASLTNVILGNGLTRIEDQTFNGCASLRSLTIPASVTFIGDWSLANCASLTRVNFLGKTPTVGGANVFNNSSAATVYYLAGTTGWTSTYGGRPTAVWVLSPTLTSFTPASGPSGTVVTLNGSNLLTITSVIFNGAPLPFTVVSDNQLTATVTNAGGTLGCITVTNSAGAATSQNPFAVLTAPTAVTVPATGISACAATFHATVNPGNLPTTAWFEWGATTNYGGITALTHLHATNVNVDVSILVTDLPPNEVCHFRVVANNILGVAAGDDQIFTTPVFPVQLRGANPLTNECYTPFRDPGAATFGSPLAIAAGGNHNLALKANGAVVAWGWNYYGQTNVPITATNVIAIAAGDSHSLVLKTDGNVLAWGNNDFGQGNVSAATNVMAIAAGYYHSLVLKADGTVLAWGGNANGETSVPAAATNIIAIASRASHNLALKADGMVLAWGYNEHGQTTVPAAATNVSAIAAGFQHSLALKADGTVLAWGGNANGETSVPAAATNIIAISAGGWHNLALKADGTVLAWGDNGAGQTNVPAAATNVVAISAGGWHNLALKADGTMLAWGANNYGQASVPADLNSLPVAVSGRVNPDVPGSYLLTYNFTNDAGIGYSVSRIVVVQDTRPPVITLNGQTPMLFSNASRIFTDPGATAADPGAGSLTVVTNNGVNVNFPGVYTIVYRATDGSGNSATNTRTVLVTLPPLVAGDANGDGAVDATEAVGVMQNLNPSALSAAIQNYWSANTNRITGLTSAAPGQFQFGLTNTAGLSFTLLVSTNLTDWEVLTNAAPQFHFHDDATNAPQRFYRLLWP